MVRKDFAKLCYQERRKKPPSLEILRLTSAKTPPSLGSYLLYIRHPAVR